jgi:glycosyltransferase involved in cell wall biosynthesis
MNILHVFRAPVGGLFRHVRDLARGQKELGHKIGLVCDSTTGGTSADALLQSAVPYCDLGIHRIEISRLPGLGDIAATRRTRTLMRKLNADVIHGHGAKGGLYARLAALRTGVPSIYTAHGGSLHYRWLSVEGLAFLSAEWLLGRIGSGSVFVCDFERETARRKIGLTGKPHAMVHNGLWREEFNAIVAEDDAADVVFMGEMRSLKGVDVLLEALAIVRQNWVVTARLVGDGPELETFQALSRKLGLEACVSFSGRLPTREGLSRGKLLVIPSRAESFPYIVLEAAAAQVPMIASSVGGIPEVLPADMTSPPGDARALARRIALALATPQAVAAQARDLRVAVGERFKALDMCCEITDFYRRCGDKARVGTAD